MHNLYNFFPYLIISLTFSLSAVSQEAVEPIYRKGKLYSSNEYEILFSFASISSDSSTVDNVMRWSPIFNYTAHLNYDVTQYLGFSGGLGIRNVGFVAKYPNEPDNLKIKYRTYNIGLPIGFKLGNLNQRNPFFLFGGYELELPFHYKQKVFQNGDKTQKITGWFSNRTEILAQSAFVGVQFPSGFSVKFKYYLNNFFNTDYREFVDLPSGEKTEVRPFDGFDVHVFYFSLTWYPFRDVNLILNEIKSSAKTITAANF